MDDNSPEQTQDQSQQQNQSQQSSSARNAMQMAKRVQQAQKVAKAAKVAVSVATSETVVIPIIIALANKKNAKRLLYVLLGIIIFIIMLFGSFNLDEEDANVSVTLKKTAPAQVANEENITYALNVSYTGNPSSITVTDKIPDNTDYVSSGGPGNPTYNATTRTVTWTVSVLGGSSSPGSTSGAGCTKVSDPSGSDWAKVNSRDELVLAKVNEVNQSVGVCVPVNLVKSLIYEESGGEMLPINGAGYGGIMQVGTGSNCDHSKYDINTLDGNVGCGIEHLAHGYTDCNSWEGTITAYYAGHCTPNGAADDPGQGGSGETDYQYRDKIINRWHEIDGA